MNLPFFWDIKLMLRMMILDSFTKEYIIEKRLFAKNFSPLQGVVMGGTAIETESERLMRVARKDVFEIMDAINNGADTLEALEELGYKKDAAKAVLKRMQKVV